jgi:hypothetical protein
MTFRNLGHDTVAEQLQGMYSQSNRAICKYSCSLTEKTNPSSSVLVNGSQNVPNGYVRETTKEYALRL